MTTDDNTTTLGGDASHQPGGSKAPVEEDFTALDGAICQFMDDLAQVFPEHNEWTTSCVANLPGTRQFFVSCVYKKDAAIGVFDESILDYLLPDGIQLSTLVNCSGVSATTRVAIFKHLQLIYGMCVEGPNIPQSSSSSPFIGLPGNTLSTDKYTDVFTKMREYIANAKTEPIVQEVGALKWLMFSGALDAYLTTHTDTIVELADILETAGFSIMDFISEADETAQQATMIKVMAGVARLAANSAERQVILDKYNAWVNKNTNAEYAPLFQYYTAGIVTPESGPLPTPESLITDAKILSVHPIIIQLCEQVKVNPQVAVDMVAKLEAEFISSGKIDVCMAEMIQLVTAKLQTLAQNFMSGAKGGDDSNNNTYEDEVAYTSAPAYSDEKTRETCDKLRQKLEAKRAKKKAMSKQQPVTEQEMAVFLQKSVDDWVSEIEGSGPSKQGPPNKSGKNKK
jgi:hypothetical protein